MSGRAFLSGMALKYPKRSVTNDYFRRVHPASVAGEGDKMLAKIWTPPPGAGNDPWTEEMTKYMDDPFRGAQGRRWLGEGESALTLETAAAKDALAAAGVEVKDVELTLVASFQPDQPGTGNAAFLAGALGLRGAAWNLETACSSALIGLETASAFVRSGQAKVVLVVASCTYSRNVAETDSLAWSVGDGACAFVVTGREGGAELLSFQSHHTAPTCGAMYYEPLVEAPGAAPTLRMRSGPKGGRAIREAAHWAIDACCHPAAQKAGVGLRALDFYAVTTPVAWYQRFFARQVGVDFDRVMNMHPVYANNGPCLMPQNLFHAAKEQRFGKGARVLLHTVGSVSSAGAAVIRWGEVGLGPLPEPGIEA